MTTAPNPPGSPEALALGCICPVLDNGHGKGSGWVDHHGNPIFWFDMNCPIHNIAEEVAGDTPLFVATGGRGGGTEA